MNANGSIQKYFDGIFAGKKHEKGGGDKKLLQNNIHFKVK